MENITLKPCILQLLDSYADSIITKHIKDDAYALVADYSNPYPGFSNGIFKNKHLYCLVDEIVLVACTRKDEPVRNISPIFVQEYLDNPLRDKYNYVVEYSEKGEAFLLDGHGYVIITKTDIIQEELKLIKTLEEIREEVAKDYWRIMDLVTSSNNWNSMIAHASVDTITNLCDKVANIYADQFKSKEIDETNYPIGKKD